MKPRTRKARPSQQDEAGGLGTSPQLSLLARLEASGESVEAMAARLFGGKVGARIGSAFRLMGVAEEVLADRWPGRRREPRGAFKLLFATAPVRISDLLYRAHAAEIVSRLPDDVLDPRSGAVWRSLELLTRAEVVGLLVEASLRHPLGHADACLYEYLFVELFPEGRLPGDALLTGASETKLTEVRRSRAEWLSRESPERAGDVRELREEVREAASVPAL